MVEEQKLQVEKVLAELSVKDKPVVQVLNKIDLVPERGSGIPSSTQGEPFPSPASSTSASMPSSRQSMTRSWSIL